MDYITRSEVMLIGQIYSNTVGIFRFMWRNVFYYRNMEFLNSTHAHISHLPMNRIITSLNWFPFNFITTDREAVQLKMYLPDILWYFVLRFFQVQIRKIEIA